ncbi:hypothetical protein GWI33_016438 [Rhynchophorus ferrugineus]|uniref:Uncharacterized protein n=1 Tax=Rhynchophorus ferrugineus TaxID=354439 RepID=A0A834IB80_RHYFE|nr:hypothetical protein GWI33_016438 [Rhynchophorus ferrugineus]
MWADELEGGRILSNSAEGNPLQRTCPEYGIRRSGELCPRPIGPFLIQSNPISTCSVLRVGYLHLLIPNTPWKRRHDKKTRNSSRQQPNRSHRSRYICPAAPGSCTMARDGTIRANQQDGRGLAFVPNEIKTFLGHTAAAFT